MTTPFRNPPRYQFLCPTAMHAEQIVAGIGRRLARCAEHRVPLRYVITCGDADTATLVRLLLKSKGLDPHGCERSECRGKGFRHRRDEQGGGPVIYGMIPVAQLAPSAAVMGPKYRPGTVVAQAQPAVADETVAAAVVSGVEADLG